jgi:hypothetical protein
MLGGQTLGDQPNPSGPHCPPNHWQAAHHIHTVLGSPEADKVRALLDEAPNPDSAAGRTPM